MRLPAEILAGPNAGPGWLDYTGTVTFEAFGFKERKANM
jgi:hypothetical protein